MSFRTFFFIALLGLFSSSVLAQVTEEDEDYAPAAKKETPKSPLRNKVVLGGNAALSFGNITLIQIAPQIGYRTTERWMNGIGGSYTYFKFLNAPAQTIFGYSAWSRYSIFQGVFVTAELEQLNLEVFNPVTALYERDNIPLFLVGAGYASGGNSGLGVSLLLMYDLIGDVNSPYANPIIRGGFLFGF